MSDQEFIAEFGYDAPVNFNAHEFAKMYYSNGNEVKEYCKCGSIATSFIFGKEARVALCNKCMGFE
jgi:hypothetical protein